MKPSSTNPLSPNAVVNAIGLAMCLSLFGDLALFASLPTNIMVKGITVANLGLVFGIHRLIRIPGNSIGGFFINRSRRRPFFLAGMVLALLSTLGYALLDGLGWMIASRLVWGLAWICIYISSMTMVVDCTTAENRGKYMGVLNSWYLVGIAGGSLAGGMLADQLGFELAMLICGGLTLLGLLAAVVWVPETKLTQPAPISAAEAPPVERTLARISRQLKQAPGFGIILMIYMINQFAGEGVALSMLSYLLKERFGRGFDIGMVVVGAASLSGLLLALRYVTSALLAPRIGTVSDRHDPQRRWTIFAGLAAGVISLLMIGYGRHLAVIVAGMVLNAFSGSAMMTALAAAVADRSTANSQGNMIGLYATAGDIGSALGPMMGYWLLNFRPVNDVFLLCAILFIGSFLLLPRLNTRLTLTNLSKQSSMN